MRDAGDEEEGDSVAMGSFHLTCSPSIPSRRGDGRRVDARQRAAEAIRWDHGSRLGNATKGMKDQLRPHI